MHRLAFPLALACACVGVGCSKPAPAPTGPTTRVTKEAIEKAKAKLQPPQPVAEARAKLVEELGEPTATHGENLIWAGVSGSDCNEVELVVQGGEAKGTIGTMANKLVESEFAKCEAHAGKK